MRTYYVLVLCLQMSATSRTSWILLKTVQCSTVLATHFPPFYRHKWPYLLKNNMLCLFFKYICYRRLKLTLIQTFCKFLYNGINQKAVTDFCNSCPYIENIILEFSTGFIFYSIGRTFWRILCNFINFWKTIRPFQHV